MASTSYAATGDMTNLNRVLRLLMGPCSDQFRDLLRVYIPPASLPAVIQKNRSKLPRLTNPQRDLILPNSGAYSGNYDDMDLSLLYILLRNFCGIRAHNKGWGETPDPADRSESANIERIRSARNRCGHATKGISKIDFNKLWSEIKAAVVDLDKVMANKDKYQKVVDFIQNDTMDPETDKHYSVQLLDQIKEIDNLKRSHQEVTEKLLVIENKHIPCNIKEQHKMLLEIWKKEDLPFHEIHSFPNIFNNVQLQPITNIIGGPGSGKTATARHVALQLQNEHAFEIVPVDEISEIKRYGNPKCKQLFILDDVFGVFGVQHEQFPNLERYREIILNVLGERSKILLTCREAVYKEASNIQSFVLNEKYLVDLEDSINQLNAEDRKQILINHCKQNDVSLRPEESPNDPISVGKMMYPLLCRLFCSNSKYQALGKSFFENPYDSIRQELDKLQVFNKIQYASLVICMLCQNAISENMIRENEPKFKKIREKVFENCKVNCRNSEIKDALDNMINTFTVRTNNGYSFIHDSVYEVLASHYGSKHQDDMLQYMSSSFVAKKFYVNNISDDLRIKLDEKHYPTFAKRLVQDIIGLDLHDVFMNEELKHPCICNAFIEEMKKTSIS